MNVEIIYFTNLYIVLQNVDKNEIKEIQIDSSILNPVVITKRNLVKKQSISQKLAEKEKIIQKLELKLKRTSRLQYTYQKNLSMMKKKYRRLSQKLKNIPFLKSCFLSLIDQNGVFKWSPDSLKMATEIRFVGMYPNLCECIYICGYNS